MHSKWDKRFLILAKEISKWSKDPSTQVGAIAVKDRRILSTGYNGFPQNIEDTDERYYDRELKYKYVVHAEMNCIYNATQNGISLNGSTMYIATLPVCPECAKGIIQVGVKRIVMEKNDIDTVWNQKFITSAKMFAEAGVRAEFITLGLPNDLRKPLVI
jgi:dCMP deaminase